MFNPLIASVICVTACAVFGVAHCLVFGLGTRHETIVGTRETTRAVGWNCGCPHPETRTFAFCSTRRNFAGTTGLQKQIESNRAILQPDRQRARAPARGRNCATQRNHMMVVPGNFADPTSV
jgi:hypothetical protein